MYLGYILSPRMPRMDAVLYLTKLLAKSKFKIIVILVYFLS